MSTEWSLVYEGLDPASEGLREALCTLGNGFFATRGAWPESRADGVHYPGTYVAGLYNRLTTEIAGRPIENEDLVNVPNWLVLDFRIDDEPWISLAEVELLAYRQELDLRRGLLIRHAEFRDGAGRETVMTQRRLVSMANPHFAGLETAFLARNWSGRMTVRSMLDGTVVNSGVARYRNLANRHLRLTAHGGDADDIAYLQVQTVQSKVFVALAGRTRVHRNGEDIAVAPKLLDDDTGLVGHEVSFDLREDTSVTVEKIVALATSRDRAVAESLHEVRRRAALPTVTFDTLLEPHLLRWRNLWRHLDIAVDGDEHTQMVLRLHMFQVLQTLSENTIDLDVGAPARGWHGEAYRGHVFWDELFVFPTLNLGLPSLTRSLLMYRRRRLYRARAAATQAGLAGAMYPWQSGSDGREESQQVHLNPVSGRWLPDNSSLQRHIDIAIAWNVWSFFQVTDDRRFMQDHGAPMLVEIARFLVSLARFNRALGRYEIRGVMGPDEYHDGYPDVAEPGLNNNAYTNVMTVWVLLRTLDALDRLAPGERAEVVERLRLRPEEVDRWGDITRRMLVPFHDDPAGQPVISQFQGYERLKEFDWDGYRARYGDISRLDRILEAEGDSTNHYKLSKQADVLMLLYLLSPTEVDELFGRLGYPLDPRTIDRTVDYYLNRTSHGSTLSSVVHSWVLARSDRARSWEFFTRALDSDITDIQGGTTAEGIHLGAMAATLDLIKRCYAGTVTRDDVLWFDPQLPDELRGVRFRLFYRNHRIDVRIDHERLTLSAEATAAPPAMVAFRGEPQPLAPGTTLEFAL